MGSAALALLRHLAAILLLPFVVTVVLPRWLLRAYAGDDSRWPAGSALQVGGRVAGALLLAAGLLLFGWCVLLFARVGRGTLAPWDPTQRLVAVGPYRHVRNPMILAVATVLAAESLLLGSRVIGVWLLTFLAINHVYFLLLEEPGLRQRFGASYDEYRRSVPRWIPRIRPWR